MVERGLSDRADFEDRFGYPPLRPGERGGGKEIAPSHTPGCRDGDIDSECDCERHCRECGTLLTAQESGVCSRCYRILTEPED